MASNNTNTNQASGPKETTPRSSGNASPPAYTPRRHIDLTQFAARVIQAQAQGANIAQVLGPRPYTTILPYAADHHEEQQEEDECSPISLRITTAVNVTKDNNIVCINSTPAEQANAIAAAVTQAIQRTSSGQCGIPMIDEDGRPRPLKIEVDASMLVEGSGNVVGTQEMISGVLGKQSLRRQREESEEPEAESSSAGAKRRRST